MDLKQDEASNPHHQQSNQIFVTVEYHILWSDSYDCLVLYFNVYDASGAIVASFEDVMRFLSLRKKDTSTDDGGYISEPIITQQDHPVLQIPFWIVHPCKTKEVMNELMPGSAQGGSGCSEHGDGDIHTSHDEQNDHAYAYLVRWLSIYAVPIGISFDARLLF